MKKDALLSECGTYRYWLTRVWDKKLPQAMFVMLNPSTADASEDDATIRKCIGFCQRLGFGGFVVINLSSFRSRDPKELFKHLKIDPRLPNAEWDNMIRSLMQAQIDGMTVICAWGRKGLKLAARSQRFLKYMSYLGLQPKALRISRGVPLHPLMLPYSCKLENFNG